MKVEERCDCDSKEDERIHGGDLLYTTSERRSTPKARDDHAQSPERGWGYI